MKRGLALLAVGAVVIMVFLLVIAGISLMTNQNMLTERKIRRTKAYYTAKAGVVRALEELRRTGDIQNESGSLNGINYEVNVGPSSTFPGCQQVIVKTVDH